MHTEVLQPFMFVTLIHQINIKTQVKDHLVHNPTFIKGKLGITLLHRRLLQTHSACEQQTTTHNWSAKQLQPVSPERIDSEGFRDRPLIEEEEYSSVWR